MGCAGIRCFPVFSPFHRAAARVTETVRYLEEKGGIASAEELKIDLMS